MKADLTYDMRTSLVRAMLAIKTKKKKKDGRSIDIRSVTVLYTKVSSQLWNVISFNVILIWQESWEFTQSLYIVSRLLPGNRIAASNFSSRVACTFWCYKLMG